MANYYQRAINAVFYANPVKLQQLIDEGHFYSRLLEDTGLMTKPFPIWHIPQCWEAAIGNVANWTKERQYLVADFLTRVHQVKEIFSKSFGIEFTPVDYQKYTDDFYAAKADESIEDALWLDSIEEAYKNGARPIDVELYYAGVRFDFTRAEELLKQGANPEAPLDEEDAYLTDRIGTEAAFLSTNLDRVFFFEERRDVDDEDMADLVGWAAHEQMYDLIMKYYKAQEDELDQNLSERGKGYIFGPDTDANSAKVWWISHGSYNQRLLVMDASRAWLLDMPHQEKNLDNYIACITAYTKDFMALYGGQTHKELALNMHHVHWNDRTIDPFIEKVKGKKEFKVLDFRVTDKSSDLDKYIKEKAGQRHLVSQECFMYWYKGVARELMAGGMTEDETLELLKRHPVDVLLIKKHCGGLTPEVLAKRILEKKDLC